MTETRERLHCLPSQTVGPFFHVGLTTNTGLGCLTSPEAKGERIQIHFRIFDGDGKPVPDAVVELWQADASGRYDHPADTQDREPDPAFCGFGRLGTDANGACAFQTVRPGRVPDGRGGCQASHISVSILARGLLGRLCTRVYFAGDATLAEDPILQLVPAGRRETLLAKRGQSPSEWMFDIHLQGSQETVFFDI